MGEGRRPLAVNPEFAAITISTRLQEIRKTRDRGFTGS
jgi:hypothetical protein